MSRYLYNLKGPVSVQLEHELEFTDAQFKEIVNLVTKRVLGKDKVNLAKLADILPWVIEELESVFGFKQVRYTAELVYCDNIND